MKKLRIAAIALVIVFAQWFGAVGQVEAADGCWRHRHIFEQIGPSYNIDPDTLQSICQHESGGNERAVNRQGSGAAGLFQLMPQTARWMGVTNIFDPVDNTRGAAKLMRYLLDKYPMRQALAAYGAGEGGMQRGWGYKEADEVLAIHASMKSLPGRQQAATQGDEGNEKKLPGMPSAGGGWLSGGSRLTVLPLAA